MLQQEKLTSADVGMLGGQTFALKSNLARGVSMEEVVVLTYCFILTFWVKFLDWKIISTFHQKKEF